MSEESATYVVRVSSLISIAFANLTRKHAIPYVPNIQKQLEGLDDASTELMMGSSGDGDGDDSKPILLLLGEAFLEATEEEATEACEEQTEALQEAVGKLQDEEEDILKEQAKLKQMLYARFGKSINLEDK